MHTGWLAAHHDALTAPVDAADLAMAVAVAARHRHLPPDQQRSHVASRRDVPHRIATPWDSLGGWRG